MPIKASAGTSAPPVRGLLFGLLLLPLAALTGCGSSGPNIVPLSAAEQELTNIVLAYMDAEQKLDRPPKSAEELKPFLKRFGDPDDLLVSPNDSEPYVVVWGARLAGGPTDYEQMFPIIAYERKGSGRKRAIVDVRGRPLTIPEGDFSKLTFAGRHKPDPGGS